MSIHIHLCAHTYKYLKTKIYFYLCVCMLHVSMYLCRPEEGVRFPGSRVTDTLELEGKASMRHLIQMLGTEFRCSGRASSTLYHWAIQPIDIILTMLSKRLSQATGIETMFWRKGEGLVRLGTTYPIMYGTSWGSFVGILDTHLWRKGWHWVRKDDIQERTTQIQCTGFGD